MPDLYRALEQLARSRQTSVDELVEDALVELVERHRPLRVVGREEAAEVRGPATAKVIPLNGPRAPEARPPGDD